MLKPNLFIVGAGKAGTSSLFEYLSCHPDIYMSEVKEPNFFGHDLHYRNTRISLEDYLGLFEHSHARYRGEASVNYLLSKTAASEIAQFNHDARIIIMIRDPVELVVSRHAQNLLVADENIKAVRDAVLAESDRRNGRRVPRHTTAIEYLFYTEWIKYTEQIRRYYQAFPRDQIFVGIFDDLRDDANRFYASLLTFLGLRLIDAENPRVVNRRAETRVQLLNGMLRRKSPAANRIAKFILPYRPARTVFRHLLLRLNTKRASGPRMRVSNLHLPAEFLAQARCEAVRVGELLSRDLSRWTK